MVYAQPNDAFKVSQSLQGVAHGLDGVFADITGNRNTSWLLMTFNDGIGNYISNNDDRDSLAECVQELLDTWRADGKTVPVHEDATDLSIVNGELKDDMRKALRILSEDDLGKFKFSEEQARSFIVQTMHRAISALHSKS